MTDEVTARPAATIVLLRDGADGLEVFMVVRHHAIDFASGALVFPGGRVEEDDAALAADTALCRNPSGLDVDAMAFRIAAIRETFEECGVLFARPDRGTALIDGAALLAVERQYRASVAEGRLSFAALLSACHLLPATDLLTHFAHWVTPRNQPKRYDTHFFLAETSAGRGIPIRCSRRHRRWRRCFTRWKCRRWAAIQCSPINTRPTRLCRTA
jgi:8-oxo-dGTP pyrophosphatase MutT (NUDIX family)